MSLPTNPSLFQLSNDSKYRIRNSLRFRSSASAYLVRTPASAGSQTKWTWSAWIKRGSTIGSNQALFGAEHQGGTDASSYTAIFFIGDRIEVDRWNGVTYQVQLNTAALLRDPSAWYHVVVSSDTTQASAANRLKIYINGSEAVYNTATYPTLNFGFDINSAQRHALGCQVRLSPNNFSGYSDVYLAEINHIDGLQLTPSYFGYTDPVTQQWFPKKYTGSYGTNGFYLPFNDATSTTTIGYDRQLGLTDSSKNNWTATNISVTAGTTYDVMRDSPTPYDDGSGGVYNRGSYATWNPLYSLWPSTLSNGNLQTSGGNTVALGSFQIPQTGKWYWEVTLSTSVYPQIGVARYNARGAGQVANFWGTYHPTYFIMWDTSYVGSTDQGGYVSLTGDIALFCIDSDNNKMWMGRSRSGVTTWLGGGDPVSGTSPTFSASGGGGVFATNFSVSNNLYPMASNGNGGDIWIINFGQRAFVSTPPSGFKALNTFNLPKPTLPIY